MKTKAILDKVSIILTWIGIGVLIALLGFLIQSFSPHIMDGFDDNYTGRGLAGLIILIFEFFLILFLGKVPGSMIIGFSILISLGGLYLSGLLDSPLPDKVDTEEHSVCLDKPGKSESNLKQVAVSKALKIGTSYLNSRIDKRDRA